MIGKSGIWGSVTASGGALACVTALAGWWYAQAPRPRPPESLANPPNFEQQFPSPARSPAAPDASAPSAEPSGPRIDVARIMANGDALIAGRTEPGARITLLDRGKVLLEAQADPATGEFVLLPPRLGAGDHQLSLQSTPPAAASQMKEIAVQQFSISPPAAASNAGDAALSGPVASDEPPAPAKGATATILRGDTLWRISREKLGRGALYPTIFQANSTKIRDPNLIYPGYTLTIP